MAGVAGGSLRIGAYCDGLMASQQVETRVEPGEIVEVVLRLDASGG